MSASDVVVRLTAAQHRELVALAEMCARPRTARAVAAAVPVPTPVQWSALASAADYYETVLEDDGSHRELAALQRGWSAVAKVLTRSR